MPTGLFSTSSQGLNFRSRRRGKRRLDEFAALLARHDAFADPPDPGGDAIACARQMGLSASSGNGMLQRLRRELGEQAK